MAQSPWKYARYFGLGLDNLFNRFVSLSRPVQLLSCAAAALQCILLAGCSASMLVSLYLVSFASTATRNTTDKGVATFELRVGYFSLCARVGDAVSWVCGDRLDERLTGLADPWNLRKTAHDYRTEVVSPALNIISIATSLTSILVVSTFPIPRATGKSQESRTRKLAAALAVIPILGVYIALLAALWQHTAAATAVPLMRYLSSGEVNAVVGPTATALAWLVFCLSLATGAMTLPASYEIGQFRPADDDRFAGPDVTVNQRISRWRRALVSQSSIELSSL